ncbi:MAG: hypothetical protein PHS44_02770, partial [Candidatus Dojkabacteria bacterium]|nr:hypothetical protein [Candidatus Dojkabacteria bacterium]
VSITSSIDYGALLPGDDTGSTNQTITVTNEGNVIIDINVSGNNMCTDYPTCSGEVLAVSNQEYSLTTFTYGVGTGLSGTPTAVDISIAKPTSSPSNSSDNTYWGIYIPSITMPGSYNGENTFEAISNS